MAKKWALLIGIDGYKELTKLEYAEREGGQAPIALRIADPG